MSQTIELVYVSRAAFTPAGGGGIEPEVARILAQSRRNNPRHNVGGVLCYLDGYFVQCLEGEADEVETVYRRIASDPRHQDVRILSRRPVTRRRFRAWSMKYAVADENLRRLLQQHGIRRFNPDMLGNELTRSVISLLQGSSDPSTPIPVSSTTSPGRLAASWMSAGAMGVSLAAMAVSLLALYRSVGG